MTQGDKIVVRLQAIDDVDSSTFSDETEIDGKIYAEIRTVPKKPAKAIRGPLSSTT